MASSDSEAVPLALMLGENFLVMELESKETFLTPIGDVGGTAGFGDVTPASDANTAARKAYKYLNDSLLINKLTERVYELLLRDLQYQRERISNYGIWR
ncbi:MAG: hypothetical protein SAK29_40990 [Scytonema sp. PMC 1069.18]|nr:hypothetical protein [Scytonema sp. PMC 1069.18]MEC4880043.1 hypothetical protein [Scytonema sp. PMC 1070.18]